MKKKKSTNIKNHFIFWYAGNKRNEIKEIIKASEHLFNDDNNIKCIVEPFAGSSCFSWYLYEHLGKKDKLYILNDSDKILMQLYEIMRDVEKLKEFEKKINEILSEEFSKDKYNKEQFNKIIRNKDKKYNDIYIYYIKEKIYGFRKNLYKPNYIYWYINLFECPIINFLQNANIILSCVDGLNIYKEYENNNEALIFLDPPYLLSSNVFYKNNRETSIYEYLFYNKIENAKWNIILCLENNFIIKMLFANSNKSIEYNKHYWFWQKNT